MFSNGTNDRSYDFVEIMSDISVYKNTNKE